MYYLFCALLQEDTRVCVCRLETAPEEVNS